MNLTQSCDMQTQRFAQTDVRVSLIGQGTWMVGDRRERERDEIAALRLGLDLGMTHVDTAEMYGNGRAEEVVGHAIKGRRDEVFLVSKVLPQNASYRGTIQACERSLKRLQTGYLDLHLLHWPGRHPIGETMRAMEQLVADGKVRFVGVSNFTAEEVERAQATLTRERIACNQVCYHLRSRGIEFSLLPFCQRQRIALVGYSPFAQGDFPAGRGRQGKVLAEVARRHGKTPRQVALKFLLREPGTFTIPKATRAEHVQENAAATGWSFTEDDVREINEVCPPPHRETPLDMI